MSGWSSYPSIYENSRPFIENRSKNTESSRDQSYHGFEPISNSDPVNLWRQPLRDEQIKQKERELRDKEHRLRQMELENQRLKQQQNKPKPTEGTFSSDKTECAICTDEYQAGEKLMSTQCGHTFHKECLLEWFQHKHICPLCKTKQNIDGKALLSPGDLTNHNEDYSIMTQDSPASSTSSLGNGILDNLAILNSNGIWTWGESNFEIPIEDQPETNNEPQTVNTLLTELEDVTIDADVSEGQVLQFNGTEWHAVDLPPQLPVIARLGDYYIDNNTGISYIYDGQHWNSTEIPDDEETTDRNEDNSSPTGSAGCEGSPGEAGATGCEGVPGEAGSAGCEETIEEPKPEQKKKRRRRQRKHRKKQPLTKSSMEEPKLDSICQEESACLEEFEQESKEPSIIDHLKKWWNS